MSLARLATAAAVFLVAGCSDGLDPAIEPGYRALEEAYVMDVKPADAVYTNCGYGLVDARHVARCGVSFGDTHLAHVGLWELEPQGAKFAAYAMNGKALAALDRITRSSSYSSTTYPGAFKSGAGRKPLDVEKVNAVIR